MPMPSYANQPSYMPQQGTAIPQHVVNYPPNMMTSGWGNGPVPMPSRVMSIAPTSSRENAQQFPVAVNTDLYIINMDAMKLYLKNNPQNPSEMREFDIVEVVKQHELPDTVSRAEFDELKTMMSQMMGMMQTNQSPNQETKKNSYYGGGKRGNKNDRSDGTPANNG